MTSNSLNPTTRLDICNDYLPPRTVQQACVEEMCLLLQALNNMITNLPHMIEQLIKLEKLQLVYRFFWDDVKDSKIRSLAMKLANSAAINQSAARHVAQQKLLKAVLPILINDTDEIEEALTLVLQHVRRSSPVVDQIRMMGGLTILCSLLLDSSQPKPLRILNASLIGAMTNDGLYGQDISEMLCDMLTSKFRRAFQSSADLLLAFCDRDHVSRGGRRWTSERRNLLQRFFRYHAKRLAPLMKSWNGTSELFNTELLKKIWPAKAPTRKRLQ